MTIQEQLFEGIRIHFPAAEAKKINKDNFLDIYVPSVNEKRGSHLFFNTAKAEIKVGFYCRDEEFNTEILAKNANLEAYSQGIRPKGNPTFNDVQIAINAANDFLKSFVGKSSDIASNNMLKEKEQITEVPKAIVENKIEGKDERAENIEEATEAVANESLIESKLEFPAINYKVPKDSSGNTDAELLKRHRDYLLNWQCKTERYALRIGINAKIPTTINQIDQDQCCPKFSKDEIDYICNQIKSHKVIPILEYIPEPIDSEVDLIWWLVPLCIWKEDTASWIAISQDGFHAPYPENDDCELVFRFCDIEDFEFGCIEETSNGDRLMRVSVYTSDGNLTFDEFVQNGKGSYLQVIRDIYHVREDTIKASEYGSQYFWYDGVGGEGFKSFNTPNELLSNDWDIDVDRPDPEESGYGDSSDDEDDDEGDTLDSEDDPEQNEETTDVYEGETKNRVRHGKGKCTYPNGDIYEGDFVEGERSGKGKLTRPKAYVYVGDFLKNELHGKGKFVFSNGRCYEGDYFEGKKNGIGKESYSGDIYEGEFFEGHRHGKGRLVKENGDVYEGDFAEGFFNGKGKYMLANGDVYHGDFLDGQQNGIGKLIASNGDVFIGEFLNGHPVTTNSKSDEIILETKEPKQGIIDSILSAFKPKKASQNQQETENTQPNLEEPSDNEPIPSKPKERASEKKPKAKTGNKKDHKPDFTIIAPPHFDAFHYVAMLFQILAIKTDGELSAEEKDSIFQLLSEWLDNDQEITTKYLVESSHVLTVLDNKQSYQTSDLLYFVADKVLNTRKFNESNLQALILDCKDIAESDGEVLPTEEAFINVLEMAWGLK